MRESWGLTRIGATPPLEKTNRILANPAQARLPEGRRSGASAENFPLLTRARRRE